MVKERKACVLSAMSEVKEDAKTWIDLIVQLFNERSFFQLEKGFWEDDVSGEREKFKEGFGLFF